MTLYLQQRKSRIIELLRGMDTVDCARILYDAAFDGKILYTEDVCNNCDQDMAAIEEAFCSIISYLDDDNCDPTIRSVADENRYP